LHDAVNDFPILVEDKKYCKDIQEATHKLFELCNSIVASSLQQTTWLRKNYAVKLMPQSSGSVNSLATSASTSAASTPANLSNLSYNNGSVVTVGGGPSAGGAMIVHNDNVSLNSVKTNVNSSGYGGSSNLTNSSTVSSVVNGSQPIKPSGNPLSDNKFAANNSSFSDVENGRFILFELSFKFYFLKIE